MIIGSKLRVEVLWQKRGFDFRINSLVTINIHCMDGNGNVWCNQTVIDNYRLLAFIVKVTLDLWLNFEFAYRKNFPRFPELIIFSSRFAT